MPWRVFFFHNMLLTGFVFIVSPASQWCDDAPWYIQQLSAAPPSVITTQWELRMCHWLDLGFAQTTDVVIVIIIFVNKDCSLDDLLQSSRLCSTFLGGLLRTYTVGGRGGGMSIDDVNSVQVNRQHRNAFIGGIWGRSLLCESINDSTRHCQLNGGALLSFTNGCGVLPPSSGTLL